MLHLHVTYMCLSSTDSIQPALLLSVVVNFHCHQSCWWQRVFLRRAPSWTRINMAGEQIFDGGVWTGELSTGRKAQSLPIPHEFCDPVGGDPIRIPYRSFPLLSELTNGVIFQILCLTVLIQYRLVIAHRLRTDRQTRDDSKYRASIASRG